MKLVHDENLLFTPLIEGLGTVWAKHLHEGQKIEVPKNYLLVDKNQAIDKLYYLEKGEVSFVHVFDDGKKRLIGKSKGPVILGESNFFLENAIMHAALMTDTPCVLYVFDKDWVYNKMIPHYPELVISLIQTFSVKTVKLVKQKMLHNFESLPDLISKFLAANLVKTESEVYAKTDLTQVELADFLGVHHISINKALKKLKDDGIIASYNKNKTIILKPELLSEEDIF